MPATFEDLAVGDSCPKLLGANPSLFRAATNHIMCYHVHEHAGRAWEHGVLPGQPPRGPS